MRIPRYLQPPVFENEEQTRVAGALHGVWLCIVGVVLATVPVLVVYRNKEALAGMLAVAVILALTGFLNQRGFAQFSSLLILIAGLAVLEYLLWVGQGIHDIAIISLPLLLIIAGLLLNTQLYIILTVLVLLSANLLIVAELSGWVYSDVSHITTYSDIVIVSSILIAASVIVRMLADNLLSSLGKTRQIAARQANLIQETRRQAEQLQTLNEVGVAVATGLDLEKVLEELYQQLKQVVPLDSFYVALIDDQLGMVTFPIFYAAGERVHIPRESLDAGSGLTGEVIRTGAKLVLMDLLDPQIQERYEIIAVGPGDTRSYIGIPLRLHQEVIGVLSIQSGLPQAYTPDQVRMLETIAAQASIAIDNARLFVEATESLKREERLNEVARVISGTLDLQFILESVVRLSVELLGADSGSLCLLTPDRKNPSDVYDFNLPEELSRQYLRSGQGISWWIIEQQRSVCLKEYALHPAAIPALISAGFHSYAGAPIMAGDECLGSLTVLSTDPLKTFIERDLALLEAVGRLAGAAIQNARLITALQQELSGRLRIEGALKHRDQMLQAMTYAAEEFLEALDWRQNMPDVLERLGRGAEVTQVFLLEVNENAAGVQQLSMRYAWKMPQSLPDFSLDDHHDIPFESDMLVMWRETLRQGKPYRGTTSPDSPHVFPDDEMGFFKARGIRSLISVPIFLGETWWGAIGFSDCFQEREWLDVETDALIVAAGLLSAAIQRQQSDEALREREALYRKAITAADAVPYYQDYSRQRFVFIGDRIEELCGYSPQELTPALWNSLILEVVPMGEGAEFAMQEAVLRARSGLAACWKCDYLIRTKSGQERWVADTSVEILGSDDRSYGSIGILQDITERKLAETAQQKAVEALRQRDNILETVAYAAETFLRAPDWESHIDEVLERLGREIGSCHTYIYQVERAADARLLLSARYEYVTREELRDIGDPRFTHVPIEKFGTRPWLDAMLRGKPYYGSLKTLPPEDVSLLIEYKVKSYLDVPILVGDQLWGLIGFENTIEEHEWSEAEIDSLIVAASVLAAAIQRQRTDQAIRQLNLELEQRVLERTAELESANRELESFAYSVSHDLRAPLRAIDGYSRFLAEDYAANLDDTGREYIENVRKATSQMGNLIDDLLKLSRVTRAEMHCEAVDLTRLSAELLDELRLGEAGRQMETIIQPGMQAYGDASLLRLALGNLIGNAWKFSGRKSQAVIEITAEQTDGRTVFSIRDNGVGFDMRYHDKLFLPFQRLHSLIDFEGTGVGLATVQRVIQRHSGQIWAEGRVGEGATFYFTLPAQS